MANTQINRIILNLIGTAQLVLLLVGIIALLVFVWGIVKLIASAGNPEKRREAKAILWWGIIGLAVIASASGIVIALQVYFGVTGARIPIPQFGPSGTVQFSPGEFGGENGNSGGSGGSCPPGFLSLSSSDCVPIPPDKPDIPGETTSEPPFFNGSPVNP